ncbi:hypothetical protein EW146_g3559 [Bondarzewia mesenterica]|uniref:Uncharacterized protein n=1 Tax=Bondarzewia mesenterica TaxID=1095465 RepID=A0A4S4M344_9AGAM|nr:hypothetical protein EW146_g3559 [Bondarzewia mesenterica]
MGPVRTGPFPGRAALYNISSSALPFPVLLPSPSSSVSRPLYSYTLSIYLSLSLSHSCRTSPQVREDRSPPHPRSRRNTERQRRKARCAPSLAVTPAEYVARSVISSVFPSPDAISISLVSLALTRFFWNINYVQKCDEQPNEEGRCQTCVRLRLQCLGFGQKRPEWLKENNNVTVFREKIKDYLAAQGMIKGHSGSGARSSENEGVLVLVDNPRSDSSSPSTPTLSAASSEDPHPRYGHGLVSDVRGTSHHYSPIMHHHPSYGAPAPYSMSELSPTSPLDSDRGHGMLSNGNDLMLPFTPTSNISPSLAMSSWHNNQSIYPPAAPSSSYSSAPYNAQIFTSSLPASYQYNAFEDDFDEIAEMAPTYQIPAGLHANILPHIPDEQNDLVRHYLDHVLTGRQYLLADKSILDFIIQTIQTSTAVRDAVCLLATLHRQAMRANRVTNELTESRDPSTDVLKTYNRICVSLAAKPSYSEDEALTGLLVVSAFLFDGGRGRWQDFLTVASNWVEDVLNRYHDTAEYLMRCSDSQRFIIKTTFWFDILASTTKLEPPRFLVFYRRLWGAPSAYIGGALRRRVGAVDADRHGLRERDRARARGDLAPRVLEGEAAARGRAEHGRARRARQAHRARVPRAELAGPAAAPAAVVRVHVVLRRREPRARDGPAPAADVQHLPRRGQGVPPLDRLGRLSQHPRDQGGRAGDDPVPEEHARGQVVALELRPAQRGVWDLSLRLEEESAEAVGNCAEAKRVMERVWQRRDAEPGKPISWRDAMQELGAESLLLV